MKRPSGAWPVSFAALFLSLGAGGGYAASGLIGSAQIKDHSIRLVDLSPAAQAALRGQTGPAGMIDPTKITSAISVPPTVVQPGTAGSATVACPAGDAAISGGGYGDIAGLDASEPYTPKGGTYPTGWYIATFNDKQVPVSINAAVVCVSP